MPVSANILVISSGPAANVFDCLADEGFDLRLSHVDEFKSVVDANPNFDLVIVVAPESGQIDQTDCIDFLNENKLPILFVGENPQPSKIQSVPVNFCDLEIRRRIQSLIRLEIMKKEYRRRAGTTTLYGFTKSDFSEINEDDSMRNILLVGNQSAVLGDILLQLERKCKVHVCRMADTALEDLRSGSFDAVIMIGSGQGDVHLRLCTDLRTDSRLFNMPVLFVLENESNREAAYVHGASDIVIHPAEMTNLYVRSNLHIHQSEFRFSLQKLFKESKPLPVTDALTSLYSYGFVQAHMEKLITDHQEQGKYLCIASITVNNLSDINEKYGYPAGDQILRQIGTIISFLIRGEDFCGRYKGNQFIIALPSTSKADAHFALKRVYGVTRNTEFAIALVAEAVSAVIDMGLEQLAPDDTFADVVKRGTKLGFTA